MCVVHKPSIPKPTQAEQDKPLPVLRNPFLDGLLGNIAALRSGRDSLRIPLNPLGIPVGGGVGGGIGSGGTGGGSVGGGIGTGTGGSTSGGSTSFSGGSISGSGSTSSGSRDFTTTRQSTM